MIADLLPSPVAAVDRFDDPEGVELFPEELALLEKSVEKRRKEFTTGRFCARTALGQLGFPPVPVLPGPKREPVWPDGVVGSITHCTGYRAAAVARTSDFRSIGIDAEPNAPTPKGVLEAIAVPTELARMDGLRAAGDKVSWDRLLFSAKESVYKAWFPLTRLWLGFEDADVTIDPDAGTFTARILVEAPIVDGEPLTGFTGRWLARDGFVITSIAVPA
ncbi:4'-phosphopantetheinyl transferase family protein [Umezawaea tangerina]|uniref:4'-phosphopantetheinyl transferase EntD n=1 Tax=Umezawaea tangerina TaxID=84725 RepID=A0A2T0SMG0_9PSEU|nr:4'-phosphopantetheinyl transferase superfamily protein [Umezawaea tangerina]PRY34594.1 4'-phosphopantetheinyl transferase EntD [Umezawaea tangerina]